MKRAIVHLAVLALVAAACGGDTPAASDVEDITEDTADAATSDGDESSSDDSGGGDVARGEATLTIGDQVYTFDNYYCARGVENTMNDSVPFSSGAFGEVDGNRAQLDASVYDPSEEDRMEGDGVSSSVTFDDVDDFENPVVGWTAGGPLSDAVVIEYDGGSVFVETTFDNSLTDEFEEIPGTLEATCGE